MVLFGFVLVFDGCCLGLVLGELYTTTGEPSRRAPVCRPCTRGFEEGGVLGPFDLRLRGRRRGRVRAGGGLKVDMDLKADVF